MSGFSTRYNGVTIVTWHRIASALNVTALTAVCRTCSVLNLGHLETTAGVVCHHHTVAVSGNVQFSHALHELHEQHTSSCSLDLPLSTGLSYVLDDATIARGYLWRRLLLAAATSSKVIDSFWSQSEPHSICMHTCHAAKL